MPTIDPIINIPARSQPAATFITNADAVWPQMNTFATQANAVGTDVVAKQGLAATSAINAATSETNAANSAASAVATAGVTKWLAATAYVLGQTAWSPITFLTYRRKIAGTTGTDPSADATNWALVTVLTGGQGGTTISASTTLTFSSPASMVVSFATPNLSITLPDATTLVKSMSQYAIYNSGEFDAVIKNNLGVVLGYVRGGIGAVFGLADNASASGIWNLTNVEKLGITAQYVNTSASIDFQATVKRVTVDATREIFLFGNTSTWGIVFDASANTWGSPTLIRATTINNSLAILSTTNQTLVTSCNATTGFQAVTLTLSGTTITVNTPVSFTLVGNISTMGNLVTCNGSFIVGYSGTAAPYILPISISGTVPTIGVETAQSPSTITPPQLYVTGTNLRVISSSTSFIYCRPYTISGITLTPGTQATAVCNQVTFRAFANGNGNMVVEYMNSNHFAAIFKLTGTVEAVSVALLDSNFTASLIPSNSGYTIINANKTLFASANGNATLNILTDTAGTASVGTAKTVFPTTYVYCSPTVTANIARLFVQASNTSHSCAIDCSGTSPTFTSSAKLVSQSSTFAITSGQDFFGFPAATNLVGGTQDYFVGQYPAGGVRFGLNKVSLVSSPIAYLPAVLGSTNSISWGAEPANLGANTGIAIQRIEAAA